MQDFNSLLELIRQHRFSEAAQALISLAAVEIAEILEEVDQPTEALVLFHLLPKDLAAEVFAFLDSKKQERIALAVSAEELKDILDQLAFDDKIDFVEEMPANVVTKILTLTPPSERKLVNQFLNYPDNSAGSLMTIEYVELKNNMTAEEGLAHLRAVGKDMETIYTLYVKDDQRHLSGVLSLRDLVTADPTAKIEELSTKEHIVFTQTTADQEEVAELFRKYNFIALPVVDKEERLVGIITVDDILDVVDEENTEDFHKMAGIVPPETDYDHTSIWSEAKSRFTWLIILMLSAMVTGRIINQYQEILSTAIYLSAFIPMLMDTGGNAGAQSSTVVIRSISLGIIDIKKDFFETVWKEFRVSIIVGLGLSLINYLRILYLDGLEPRVALVVSVTLFCTIIMAKLLGAILPVGAKNLGFDPAVMASPLITTIVDACALIIYFRLAIYFLGI